MLDWVTELPHFPRPDEKIDAISENYFPGGVTANYLVAVARLGVSCGFIGAVGNDMYGDFLIHDFKNEKIDTKYTLKKKGMRTPLNFIFIVKGQKTIIQSPHMKKTKLEISDVEESYISKAQLLHTTLIHPILTEKVINMATQYNVKISIDLEAQIAQYGWKNLRKMLLMADVVILNKEGAKIITKCENPEECAKFLIQEGIPIVIITLADKGALVATAEFQIIIPTYYINNIIDTTGAGDTFNGAFSVAYFIKKWNLKKSIKYANAAASLKIQKLGARTGMPYEPELIKFLKAKEKNFFSK